MRYFGIGYYSLSERVNEPLEPQSRAGDYTNGTGIIGKLP